MEQVDAQKGEDKLEEVDFEINLNKVEEKQEGEHINEEPSSKVDKDLEINEEN
jgi:hypothetical protein